MAYIQIPAFSKTTNLNNDDEFVIVVDGVEYLVSFKTLSEKFGNSPELLQQINAEIEALRNIVDAFPTENPAAPIALKIADTPTIDGMYKPTETGVYPNAGGLEYDPTEGITYFIRTQGVWTKDVTPINFTPTGVVEEGNTEAVSGCEVYDSLKPTQELNDRQNLQNTNYFNKTGYFVSKNHGNEGVASNRKCTPFLFINPLEDIIVTGYDGADTENTSLCNFYDSNKVFLGRYTTGETAGQKNNVLISKDFISANYPTAIFIRCSASTAQLNASVYGVTNTKTLDYIDAKISNLNALDLLLIDTIPDSSESVTITDGRVTRVMNYTLDETPVYIRQIDYTYNENEIIEIRQLNQPYIKLQKKTNLITLNTEVTWL